MKCNIFQQVKNVQGNIVDSPLHKELLKHHSRDIANKVIEEVHSVKFQWTNGVFESMLDQIRSKKSLTDVRKTVNFEFYPTTAEPLYESPLVQELVKKYTPEVTEVPTNIDTTLSKVPVVPVVEKSKKETTKLELTDIAAVSILPTQSEEQTKTAAKPTTPLIKEEVAELFESNESLANAVYEAVGFKSDYNGISIELGRSADRDFGKVQNIIISYDGKSITSQDGVAGLGEMNVVIKNGEVVVGMIRLPQEHQGKGLTKYIYQAVADKLGLPIVNSKLKGYNQSESGGYIWKNRTSFQPNQITQQQKQQAQELYSQYLEQNWNNPLSEIKKELNNQRFKLDEYTVESSVEENENIKSNIENVKDFVADRITFQIKNKDNKLIGLAVFLKKENELTWSANNVQIFNEVDRRKGLISSIYGLLFELKIPITQSSEQTDLGKVLWGRLKKESGILGSEQDIEGFKEFVEGKSFDKELAQKIQDKLQKLYPQIKLNITNNPVWEQGDNIFNQDLLDAESKSNIFKLTENIRKANRAFDIVSVKDKMTVNTTANILISNNPLKYLFVSNQGIVTLNVELLSKDIRKELGDSIIPEKALKKAEEFNKSINDTTQIEQQFEIYKKQIEEEKEYYESLLNKLSNLDNKSEKELFDILINTQIYFKHEEVYQSFSLKGKDDNIFTYQYKNGKPRTNKYYDSENDSWIEEDSFILLKKIIQGKRGNVINHESFENQDLEIEANLALQEFKKDKERIKKAINKLLIENVEHSLERTKFNLNSETFKSDYIRNAIYDRYEVAQINEEDFLIWGIESLIKDNLIANGILNEYNEFSKPFGFTADNLLKLKQNKEYQEIVEKRKKINNILSNKEKYNNDYDNYEQDDDVLAPIPGWFLNAVSVANTGKYFDELKGFTSGLVKGVIYLDAQKQYDDLYDNGITPRFQQLVDTKDINSLIVNKINFVNSLNLSNDLAILNQKDRNKIIGQANIKAMTVLIDAIKQKQDTLPHEYAHHYIAWFRNTPIVQEAIKKWGSEEALVQSIGEQVVKQEGEALNWWNNFVKWIMSQFSSLSKLQKEELTQILTDAFLTRQNLSQFFENKKDGDLEQSTDIDSLLGASQYDVNTETVEELPEGLDEQAVEEIDETFVSDTRNEIIYEATPNLVIGSANYKYVENNQEYTYDSRIELTPLEKEQLAASASVYFVRNLLRKQFDVTKDSIPTDVLREVLVEIADDLVDKLTVEENPIIIQGGSKAERAIAIAYALAEENDNRLDSIINIMDNMLKVNYKINLNIDNGIILEVTEQEDENIAEESKEEVEDEVDVQKDRAFDKNSTEFDTKDGLPKIVRLILGSLLSKDSKGNLILNDFGLPIPESSSQVTNFVVNNFAKKAGNVDDIIQALKEGVSKISGLEDLLQLIGENPKNTKYGSSYVFNPEKIYLTNLRTKLFSSLANTRYEYEKTLTNIKDGRLDGLSLNLNNQEIKRKLLADWENNLKENLSQVNLNTKEGTEVFKDILENSFQSSESAIDFLGIRFDNITGGVNETIQNRLEAAIEVFVNKLGKIAELDKKLDYIRSFYKANTPDGFYGTLSEVALYALEHGDNPYELAFFNSENKKIYGISLYNYQSLVTDKLNMIVQKGKTTAEREQLLKEHLPQLWNTFSTKSQILQKILDGNISTSQLTYKLLDGFENEERAGEGVATKNLNPADFLVHTLIQTLSGNVSQIKHSDRSIFPALKFTYGAQKNTLFSLSNSKQDNINIAVNYFRDYLQADINAGRVFKKYKEEKKNILNFTDREQYESTFFGSITLFGEYEEGKIPTDSNRKVQTFVSPNTMQDLISGKLDINSPEVTNILRKYAETTIRNAEKLFSYYGIFKDVGGGKLELNPKLDLNYYVSGNSTPQDLVTYAALNFATMSAEASLLFFGNYNFYSSAVDLSKRTSTQSSTGSLFINSEETRLLREYYNAKEDSLIPKENGKVSYQKYGLTADNPHNLITEVVMNDISVISKDLTDAAKGVNEFDGASWVNMFFTRELMLTRGTWSDEHQNTFVEELKYLFGEQKFEEMYAFPKGAETTDYLEFIKKNYRGVTTMKPAYSGPAYSSVQQLEAIQQSEEVPSELIPSAISKTSYVTLMPSMFKKGSVGFELAKWTILNGIDVIHTEGARKSGAYTLRSIYDGKGKFNNAPLVDQEVSYLDMGYLKDQVKMNELPKKKITDSTQSRKTLNAYLTKNQIPIDVKAEQVEEYREALQNQDYDKMIELSPLFRDSLTYGRNVVALLRKQREELLKQIDAQIVRKNIGGKSQEVGIINNFRSFIESVKKQAEDRGSDINILKTLDSWAENKPFIELLPNYSSIEYVLNASINKKVIKLKRPGDAQAQVPVTLFEDLEKGRKTDKSGKKILESDELKMYELVSKDGVEQVTMAEVMMPLPLHFVNNLMRNPAFSKANGLAHLVELVNEKLASGELEFTGKAVRIPNQDLNSNDFVKVKKFLVPLVNNAIVAPSTFIAKNGSDFDIDKLQFYYKERDANFETIEYLEDKEALWEKYGIQYIKQNYPLSYNSVELIQKMYDNLYKKVFKGVKNVNKIYYDAFERFKQITYLDTLDDLIVEEVNKKILNLIFSIYKRKIPVKTALYNFANSILHFKTFYESKLENITEEIENIIEDFNNKSLSEKEIETIINRNEYLNKEKQKIQIELGYIDKILNIILSKTVDKRLDIDIDYLIEKIDIKVKLNAIKNKLKENKRNILERLKDRIKPEFMKKSVEELNPVTAHFSRILDSEQALILNPSRYKYLTTPNGMDTLEKISSDIIGKDASERKKVTTFGDMTQMHNLVKNTIDFLESKGGTGQSVTWVTFAITAQEYNLSVEDKYVIGVNKDGELVEETTKFPEEFGIGDSRSISEPFIQKEDMEYAVSTLLSEVVTSKVDGVKNPIAVEINMINETLDFVCYCIVRGVSLDFISEFLNRKDVSNYLRKQSIINKSLTGLGDSLDNKKWKKPTADIHHKTGEIEKSLPKDVKTFLKIKRQALAINSVKKFLNADSKDIKNMSQIINLQNTIENIEKTKIIDLAKINNPTRGEENHFLNQFINNRELHYQLTAPLYLTQTNQVINTHLNRNVQAISEFTYKENAKVKATERLMQDLISSLIQIAAFRNSKTFSEEGITRKQLQEAAIMLFSGKTSLPKTIQSIKRNPNHPLHNNLFIKELLPLIDNAEITVMLDGDTKLTKKKIDNLQFLSKPSDGLTRNIFIEEVLKIKEEDPSLYRYLLFYDLFQTGQRFSRYKLSDLLPTQDLSQLTYNIQNLELSSTEMDIVFKKILLSNPRTLLPKDYQFKNLSSQAKDTLGFHLNYNRQNRENEVVRPKSEDERRNRIVINEKFSNSIYFQGFIFPLTDKAGNVITPENLVAAFDAAKTTIEQADIRNSEVSENNEVELLQEFGGEPEIYVDGLSDIGNDIFNNFDTYFEGIFPDNVNDEFKKFIAKSVEDGNLEIKCGLNK